MNVNESLGPLESWLPYYKLEPEGKLPNRPSKQKLQEYVTLCYDRALLISIEMMFGKDELKCWGVDPLTSCEAAQFVSQKANAVRQYLTQNSDNRPSWASKVELNLLQKPGVHASMQLRVLPPELAEIPGVTKIVVSKNSLVEPPKWSADGPHPEVLELP